MKWQDDILGRMPSPANENDRNLLDSAARVFRGRMTPGSRYHELLDSGLAGQDSAQTYELDLTEPESANISLPATERLSRSVAFSLPQIGDMPPEPPTFRGRVGAVLVGVVRRALFWYTAQIKTFHAAVAEAAREWLPVLRNLDAQQRRQRALIAEVRHRLIELERQTQLNQAAIASSVAALAPLQDELRRYRQSSQDGLRQLDHRVESLDQRVGSLDQAVGSLHQTVASLDQRIGSLEQTVASQDERIRSLDKTIASLDQRVGSLDQAQAFFVQDNRLQEEENRRQKETLAARIGQLDDALAAARETHFSFREEEERHREAAAAGWKQIETAVDQYQLIHASYRERESLQRSEFLARLAQIDAALAATRQTKAAFEEELRQDFKAEAKEIRKQVHEARTHLLQQELRLKMLVGELRKRAVAPTDVAAVVDELAHINDRLFVDHAASFRGARADIKKRLAVYLPYVQEAFAAAMKSPALDLGCGRGEWMELLGEAGIPAKGIDLNRDLISACREMGLDVMEGEVSQFLQKLPNESCSIVTAFHILEHIPFPNVVELIDQAVRILKPGGIAIFETPNPKNLFVSSNNFYLDPTHRNPIPSEFLAFLVEARGLCDPKVIPLSPYPDYLHLPESDCPAVRFINEHFFGPQDYGVVTRKI